MFALTLLLLTGTASAQDEDVPEFLLEDFGVRVDLPAGWKMTRWSTFDFKAKTADNGMALSAWATPIEQSLDEADLPAWAGLFSAKLEETGNADIRVTDTWADGDSAKYSVEFAFSNGRKGVLYGASMPVKGHIFHVEVHTLQQRAKQAVSTRDGVLARLEIASPPEAPKDGPTLETKGITTTLPAGWREPGDAEKSFVFGRAANLGVDLSECWVALHPRAAADPDVMVACQGGTWLGVVDEHTFEDVDQALQAKLFGDIDVPDAERLTLGWAFCTNPRPA
jgi:hypothetical protein